MGEHIYLELDNSQVQLVVEALAAYGAEQRRMADYYEGEKDKLRVELAKLKAELADAKNLAEAAVAAQTEKEAL
jgi:hypothetical protein